MLVMNCGNYEDAVNYNAVETAFGKEQAMAVPGTVAATPKQWSNLGADYAQDQLENQTKSVVNVFTNNDHFMNGIRVKIKEANLENSAVAEQFTIRFFPGDGREVIHIKINNKGKLDRWPEGFFDQLEDDLSKL